MSRYIDVDAFKQELKENYTFYGFTELLNDFYVALDEQPTIEPKHGEWERVSADKYVQHAYHYYRCSKCGYDHIGKTNFCPNCGADMREVRDE